MTAYFVNKTNIWKYLSSLIISVNVHRGSKIFSKTTLVWCGKQNLISPSIVARSNLFFSKVYFPWEIRSQVRMSCDTLCVYFYVVGNTVTLFELLTLFMKLRHWLWHYATFCYAVTQYTRFQHWVNVTVGVLVKFISVSSAQRESARTTHSLTG